MDAAIRISVEQGGNDGSSSRFSRLFLALGLLAPALVSVADNGPRAAGATKVAFIPPEGPIEKALDKAPAAALTEDADYVFSAPPRGSYAEEVAAYQPITEYLSRVTGSGSSTSTPTTG